MERGSVMIARLPATGGLLQLRFYLNFLFIVSVLKGILKGTQPELSIYCECPEGVLLRRSRKESPERTYAPTICLAHCTTPRTRGAVKSYALSKSTHKLW